MSTADSGMSRKKTSKLKGNFLAKNLELRAYFKTEIIKGQRDRDRRTGWGRDGAASIWSVAVQYIVVWSSTSQEVWEIELTVCSETS